MRDTLNMSRDCANRNTSVWVFVLLGHEAIKTWKQNPWFRLVKTWDECQ